MPSRAKTRLVAAHLLLILLLLPGGAGIAASKTGLRYAGIEFYGSSQLSRSELARMLSLKPGASLASVDRAVEQLNRRLALKNVNSLVQIVQVPPDQIYVVVDVPDSTVDAAAPTRRLKDPRHVLVRSEKPFLLMDQLEKRLEKLSMEGRPWHDDLREGLRYFSDEPANQIVEQIVRQVPDMRDELLAVVASDPDPVRRRRAVELMQWAGAIPDTFLRLTPAIDDADSGVRAAVARYMFPRFEMLPDEYPFQDLVEAYTRMLARPSHQDRTKSLYCLLALAGQRSDLIPGIKVFTEERVKKLADLSVIPSVKNPAAELQIKFMSAAEPIGTREGSRPDAPADWSEGGFF